MLIIEYITVIQYNAKVKLGKFCHQILLYYRTLVSIPINNYV